MRNAQDSQGLNSGSIALKALEVGTKAITQIEQHEKTCATRWSLVVRLMLLHVVGLIGGLTAILGVLLSDKFF